MSRAAQQVAALMPPVWIRGPKLRERWGMPLTTFHRHLKAGKIPQPQYPFGPETPYWRTSDIEAFEEQAGRAQQRKKA